MVAHQIGRLKLADADVLDQFGFGLTTYSNNQRHHEQLRGAYAWFGFWTTSFRVSPRGDWILVTMSQKASNKDNAAWIAPYEKIAAEAIEK